MQSGGNWAPRLRHDRYRRSRNATSGPRPRRCSAKPGGVTAAIDPGPDDLIIEIGPGRGALTFPLAERAGRVVAVEKDPEAVRAMGSRPRPNVEVIEADILGIDPAKAARAVPVGSAGAVFDALTNPTEVAVEVA